jgi:hypothetical protein
MAKQGREKDYGFELNRHEKQTAPEIRAPCDSQLVRSSHLDSGEQVEMPLRPSGSIQLPKRFLTF